MADLRSDLRSDLATYRQQVADELRELTRNARRQRVLARVLAGLYAFEKALELGFCDDTPRRADDVAEGWPELEEVAAGRPSDRFLAELWWNIGIARVHAAGDIGRADLPNQDELKLRRHAHEHGLDDAAPLTVAEVRKLGAQNLDRGFKK